MYDNKITRKKKGITHTMIGFFIQSKYLNDITNEQPKLPTFFLTPIYMTFKPNQLNLLPRYIIN